MPYNLHERRQRMHTDKDTTVNDTWLLICKSAIAQHLFTKGQHGQSLEGKAQRRALRTVQLLLHMSERPKERD